MRLFFFGVWDAGVAGHYLYESVGHLLQSPDMRQLPLPFNYTQLDGGFLPKCAREEELQGVWHLTHVDGWTIISSWDRTGDERHNSSASFVLQGERSLEEACQLAADRLPALWARINRSSLKLSGRTYVLYHANCADGFAAAYCAWRKFGGDAEYIPVSYGQPMPAMEDGASVFILDFSYKRGELLALRDRMHQVLVLDHHATAEAELIGIPFARFNLKKSGARMAWEYFFPGEPVPALIRYVEDRDLWIWGLPESKEFNAALATYEHKFEVWNSLANHTYLRRFIEEGTAILRLVNKNVEMQCKARRMAAFYPRQHMIRFVEEHPECGEDCHLVPVVNATCHVSEVGHRLLELEAGASFVGIYFDKADGSRGWSLRSRPGFDCSPIAKAFGGGGHPQACGFTQSPVEGVER